MRHFINLEYKVVLVLLAFRNLLGPHLGKNITDVVEEVI